jgi:hypothetical protein
VLTFFEEVKINTGAVKICYIFNKLFVINRFYYFCILGLFNDELID